MNPEPSTDNSPEEVNYPSSPPWYYHLYRPETLAIYILAGLGLYFYLMSQAELRLERLYPLDNGSALGLGFDERDEGKGLLQVWLTGIDGESEWITELEGNFLPTDLGGDQAYDETTQGPFCSVLGGKAFILQGQDNGSIQRVSALTRIDLDNGDIDWTTSEQPVGDAEFGTVFAWKDHLVTSHIAKRSKSSKIYLVGRAIRTGSMIWTKVFNLPYPDPYPSWKNRISFLPGGVLVNMDSLYLINSSNGEVLHAWAGEAPYYSGGWVFYQTKGALRCVNAISLTDSTIMDIPSDTITWAADAVRPPQAGHAGFYGGFPMWLHPQFGWIIRQNGTSLTAPYQATTAPGIRPASLYGPGLLTRPHFMDQELKRYLPMLVKFSEPDTLKRYFPETMGAQPYLSGLRMVVLDLEAMKPALVSPDLDESLPKAFFTTLGDYHYLIARNKKPGSPFVAQFSGLSGGLVKVLEFEKGMEQLRLNVESQGVGGRIWLDGVHEWAALSLPDLELVYSNADSLEIREATAEYRKRFGYE